MEYERRLIYFSTYENGVKTKRAGYAAIFVQEQVCNLQIYYRGSMAEVEGSSLQPVYVFRDGTVIRGDRMILSEGMATTSLRTNRQDFVQSGRTFEELEVIYIDGVSTGICGGRTDGREIGEFEKQPEQSMPQKRVEKSCNGGFCCRHCKGKK
jgi:hypothetical protein